MLFNPALLKKYLLLFSTVLFYQTLNAQLIINSSLTPAQLVSGFMGSGLTVSNINLNCPAGAYGTFSNGNTTNLGVTTGSIFTSGSAAGSIGPNNSASYSVNNGTSLSDPDLTTIEPNAVYDPCILTFDVVPSCSTLTIRFVFGSEEYPEYVNASFNDAFGFFITGPNPSGPFYSSYNVARLPNTTPVSIDNVNAGNNAAYYVNNAGGPTVQYDGFTTVITSNLAVTPCATYTFKIAIADAGDQIYDSGVFIDFLTCSTAITTTSSSTPTCQCNGTATVNPSGGQPPYTYVWNTSPPQNTQTATGLCPGTYVCTVYDATGCFTQTNNTSVTVNALSAGSPYIQSQTNVSCNGGNNGCATANISGGTGPFTYLWSNGDPNQTACNLSAGTYNVTITDANGCVTGTSVTINQPSPLISSTSSTPAGCSVANGSATVNPSGGTPGYTYLWSNGDPNQTANNLSSGTYNVTITDANGCTAVNSVVVGGTAAPTVTASSTQATCATANGTATANPSGGTPGYTYLWSDGQVTQTAVNLTPGTYNVTVTDANGCTAQISVTVSAANGPTATANAGNNVSCNGGTNGCATVIPSGGTAPYTYLWSNGDPNQTACNLGAGTYNVTVTDANNCPFVTSVTISEPTALATTTTQTNINCGTGNNGTATVNPSGGTPGYTYLWSDGQVTQTAVGLATGTYTVTVTDVNGCTTQTTVTITSTIAPTTSSTATNVDCNGGNNGSATTNPSGGAPNYTYAWSPIGGNGQTANNLPAGTYTVLITDANGCTATDVVTITEPTALAVASSVTNVTCFNANDGTATATPSGGTPGYTYSWSTSPAQNTQTAINLGAGTYQCTVTDANGCITVIAVTITAPAQLGAGVTQTNPTCSGSTNGTATANPSGGSPNYNFSWNTTPPQNQQTATNLSAGTYQCTVTDANGCTTIATVTITSPAPLALSITCGDSVCFGDTTTLSVTATGGTPNYTYVWAPGPMNGSTLTVAPTANSSYTVSATDANGCTSLTQTCSVIVLPSATALFDTASNSTYSSTYSFTDLSSGGTSWLWNFGDNSSGSTAQNPVHTFPGAGTYTVTQIAFNQYGCPDTFLLTVIVDEGILIPNVFTPDNNGSNDVWYIPNSGMKEFHVEIYDRWGLKVWETTADEIRWDGHSFSGKLLNDGTYYFVLHAVLKTSTGAKNYSTNGYVTLLTNQK